MDEVDQLPCELRLGGVGGVLPCALEGMPFAPVAAAGGVGLPEAKEQWQEDRALAEGQAQDDPQDDPAVAVANLLATPVDVVGSMQMGAEDLGAAAGEDRVVDGEAERSVARQEALGHEVEQAESELVRRPARAGEEVVGAGVMPGALQASGLEHSRDRVLADAADEAGAERAEGPVGRTGKATSKQGKQRGERIRGEHRHLRDWLVWCQTASRGLPVLLSALASPPPGSGADSTAGAERRSKSRNSRSLPGLVFAA